MLGWVFAPLRFLRPLRAFAQNKGRTSKWRSALLTIFASFAIFATFATFAIFAS